MAYVSKGSTDITMRDALVDAGAFLLAKTNNFSIADGYLAVTLDALLSPGPMVYSAHVKSNFYDKLLTGDYQRAGDPVFYTTEAFLTQLRTQRGGLNIAAWDMGMGLYAVTRMREHLGSGFLVANAWNNAVKAEVEAMEVPGYYDVVALSGAIIGLARADIIYDPPAGPYASANGLADLVATLMTYQVPSTGAFAWQSNMLTDADSTTQETAYAILALVEARAYLGVSDQDAAIVSAIDDAATWLVATQTHNGGWLDYIGEFEYAEVDAEAVWALVAAEAY